MIDNPRYSQMVRAAELYYERYLGQREIAKILGASTSTVSRLLAEARTAGIIKITIERPIEKHPELSEQLRKAFNLRDAVVVSGDPDRENALRNVGAATAELLLSILEDNTTIGISWGPGTYNLVQAIGDTPMNGIEVIQMLGGLGGGEPWFDGPELALRLAEHFHGIYRYVQAPAIVESKEMCRMLLQQPSICETLERVAQAHVKIAGIGSLLVDGVSSLQRAGYLSKEERLAYLSEGSVGHTLARMFDINGNELASLNERVVALTFEQLRQAEWSICMCEAAWKAPAVLGALRGQFFNTLVITDDAAQNVLDLANQDMAETVPAA